MTKISKIRSFGVLLSFTFAILGCERSQAPSGAPAAATASAAPTVSANQSAAKVTRIVFVGKEHPCECTRKTLDAGWAALQTALGTPATLPVERLQIDTEPAKVEPYRKQKPVMALPGIYFVDQRDAVLELLQGEVTSEQVAAVLKTR
jgi:hypothetical protein